VRGGDEVLAGKLAEIRPYLGHGGTAAQAGWLQPAGQRQDDRRKAARRPRRAVSVHQRQGAPVPGHRRSSHICRYKNKELVGDYENGGREWQPRGQPEQVNVHDFKGELGEAVPYGVYDVAADTGWIDVG
jgi:hypothetical protein